VDQFAAEKLACLPETERTTRERHCVYFMEFTAMKAADYRRERQPAALDRLDAEFGNIQSAWQYAARTGRWPEVDLALEGMFLFYDVRSRFREGQETLDGTLQAMRQIDELSSDQRRILGRLLARLGRLEIYLGQQARAEELLSESLENLKDFPAVMEYAAALSYQGIICHYRGQPSQAYAYAADSLRLSQQTGNRDGEAFCLNLLGNLAQSQGDYNQAQAHYRQNLAIREELHDDFGVAIACNNLGNLAHARGRLEEAQAFYERSCASFERIGYSLGLATGLTNAGFVSMKLGRTGEAQAMLERSLRLKRDLGQPLGIANTLANLGELACRTGKLKEAAEYLRDAMDIAMQLKAIPLAVELLACFATLFVKQGKKQTALELLALADAHPSARHETRARAAELLSQLESELPREEFMAAQERGRQLQLEAIAEELSLTQQRRIV
jgi:tetratricopeptide (TPR) repeat protein